MKYTIEQIRAMPDDLLFKAISETREPYSSLDLEEARYLEYSPEHNWWRNKYEHSWFPNIWTMADCWDRLLEELRGKFYQTTISMHDYIGTTYHIRGDYRCGHGETIQDFVYEGKISLRHTVCEAWLYLMEK